MLDDKSKEKSYLNVISTQAQELFNKLCDQASPMLLAINAVLLDMQKKPSMLSKNQQKILRNGIQTFFDVTRSLLYLSGKDKLKDITADQVKRLLECEKTDGILKELFNIIINLPQFVDKDPAEIDKFKKDVELVYSELSGFVTQFRELLEYIHKQFVEDELSENKDPNVLCMGSYESIFTATLEQGIINKTELYKKMNKIQRSSLKEKQKFIQIIQSEIIDSSSEVPKIFKEIMVLKRLGLLKEKEAAKALKQNKIYTLSDLEKDPTILNESNIEKVSLIAKKSPPVEEVKQKEKKQKRRRSPQSERNSKEHIAEKKSAIASIVYSNKEELMKIEEERLNQLSLQKAEEIKKQKELAEQNKALRMQKALEKENQTKLGKKTNNKFKKHPNHSSSSYSSYFYTNEQNQNIPKEIKPNTVSASTETDDGCLKIAEYLLKNKKQEEEIKKPSKKSEQPALETVSSHIFLSPPGTSEERLIIEIKQCLAEIRRGIINPTDKVRTISKLLKSLNENSRNILFSDKDYGELLHSIYQLADEIQNDKKIETLLNIFYTKIFPMKFIAPS